MEGDEETILGKVVSYLASCTNKEGDIRDFADSWRDLVQVLGVFQTHVHQFPKPSDF